MLKIFYIILILLASISTYAEDNFAPADYASVQLLNKLTGKTEQVKLSKNLVYKFDKHLQIILRECYKSTHSDNNENQAFFQIVRLVQDEENDVLISALNKNIPIPKEIVKNTSIANANNYLIFSGWMFSSSPSISLLQDKVYSVVLLKCLY